MTVVWKPDLCIHSQNCFKGLPEVFNPQNRPWVNMSGATGQAIKGQVAKCPSGALSTLEENESGFHDDKVEIELMKNGPILIHGTINWKDSDGNNHKLTNMTTAFCRCGASSNKPLCDGTHKNIGFSG